MANFRRRIHFKLRRQSKYENLRNRGFTDKEAKAYSKITYKNSPYLKVLMRERERALRKHILDGGTKKSFERRVIPGEYKKQRWLTALGGIDPWQQYRAKQNKYISEHPEWESPLKKSKSPRAPLDIAALQRRPKRNKGKSFGARYEAAKGR